MTSHWMVPRQAGSAGPSAGSLQRAGRFELEFLRHGDRTAIGRQLVSYPFHLTRPFALDRAIPSLLTVYQQSSSGGLYRAEQLSCRYRLGKGAAAHVTTQAATIVHDCYGQPAQQRSEVIMEEGAFLALTPDPLVLFPGASLSTSLDVGMASGAVLLIADAFAMHDPHARSRPFDRLESDITIRDATGRLLVRDCFRVSGDALTGSGSPIGGWRVMSNFLLVGEPSRLPAREDLMDLASDAKVAVGVSTLASGAGLGVRCLAGDAIAARRVSEAVFSRCVGAAFGHAPSPRRK